MKNVLFAIGHKKTEEILQDALKSEGLNVVGVVTYKSGILKKIEETRPDVVVIRENILGNENILDIIFEIRTQYPAVRVVFFAETEEDGNNMIATLVSYGIYDILSGKKLKLAAMVNIIKTPRTLKDIGKFNITTLPFTYRPNEEEEEKELKEGKGLLKRLFKDKSQDKVIKTAVEPYEKEAQNKEILLANTEKEINRLKDLIKEKENKIKELKDKGTTLEATKNSLENEVVSLKTKKEFLEKEIQKLEKDKANYWNLYIANKDKKVELEQELLKRRAEVEELEFKIKELKESSISEEDKIKLEAERDFLEKEVKEKIEGIEELKVAVEEKSKKFEKLKREYESKLSEEVEVDEGLEKVRDELNKIIEAKIKEKDELDSNFKNKREEIEKIKEEIEKLGSDLKSMNEEYDNLADKRDELLAEKMKLEKNILNLSFEIERAAKNNENLLNKVESDTITLENLQKEAKKISSLDAGADTKLQNFRENMDKSDEDDFIDDKKVRVKISERASNKCQLISFLGSKSGVGNTTIALNTAAVLAGKYKVLYIETDDKYPYSSYLYELDNVNKGLEFALKSAAAEDTEGIYKNIVKSANENVHGLLDFLTVSSTYLIDENAEPINTQELKALIRDLKADNKYDYIVMDIKSDNNSLTESFLKGNMYSDILYITLTQDIHSVACAFSKKKAVNKEKAYFVINRYDDKCKLKLKDIAEWIESPLESFITISLDYAMLMNLNIDGMFYSLQKGKGYIFSSIVSNILALK
ncbi:MAG: AAA family ATPase [Tissierellia bacterium]|jgi:Flp pilus assembly CpaE family ATPase|nr:AAA family ATPase [Tissierellia bacterium]